LADKMAKYIIPSSGCRHVVPMRDKNTKSEGVIQSARERQAVADQAARAILLATSSPKYGENTLYSVAEKKLQRGRKRRQTARCLMSFRESRLKSC
jgi:hypothetical protein